MNDWTEIYRPDTLNKIIGNKNILMQLKKWSISWEKGKPSKKAVILSGKPGIGKTSCAYALAYELNWIPIELNTSDARNKERIKVVATAGSNHQSFTDDGMYLSTKKGGRKLIILDEADNLYERIVGDRQNSNTLSDRGGKKAIIETIEQTKQPIILIVNDYYNLIKGSGKVLEKLCLHLKCSSASSNQIYALLSKICSCEKIFVDSSILQKLSNTCQGDVRSAIRDLQSICIGKKEVLSIQNESIGMRDHEEQIFSVLSSIFKTYDIMDIKNRIRHLDIDPQLLLYWISENIPRLYRKPSDLFHAFHHASKADIFLSRTLNRGNYRMWAYALDHMSCGVSLSKTTFPSNNRFQYSSWIRTRMKRDSEKEILFIQRLASLHHCSFKKAKQELYPIVLRISKMKGIDVEDFFAFNDRKENNTNNTDNEEPRGMENNTTNDLNSMNKEKQQKLII